MKAHYRLDWPRAYQSNAPTDDSTYFPQSSTLGHNNVTRNGVVDMFPDFPNICWSQYFGHQQNSAALLDISRWGLHSVLASKTARVGVGMDQG